MAQQSWKQNAKNASIVSKWLDVNSTTDWETILAITYQSKFVEFLMKRKIPGGDLFVVFAAI